MKAYFKFLPAMILALAGILLIVTAFVVQSADQGWQSAEAIITGTEVFGTGESGFVRVEFKFSSKQAEHEESFDTNACLKEECATEVANTFPKGDKIPVFYRLDPESKVTTTRLSPPMGNWVLPLALFSSIMLFAASFMSLRRKQKRIFHVSEESGLAIFHPRPSANGDAVWAVDGTHVCNYLLPRDCPRVTYAAPDGRVVAVEEAWLERIKTCRLHLYEFSPVNFECIDKGAGYFISRRSEKTIAVTVIDDAPAALKSLGVKLEVLPDLWALHDKVSAGQTEFSIIRMRNAKPRST